MCSFRGAEIVRVSSGIAEECDLPHSYADEALSMMRTFCNGYRLTGLQFNPRALLPESFSARLPLSG